MRWGIRKPQNRLAKQSKQQNRNEIYQDFRFAIPLEIQPHLFSNAFHDFFGWKFVKILVFKFAIWQNQHYILKT